MTVTFHALWMLCALGGVVLATAAARDLRAIAAFSCGLLAAAVFFGQARMPDAQWAGALGAGAAACYLFRPRLAVLPALAGGVLGGLSAALVEAQGAPAFAAIPSVILLMIATVWLARTRPSFAPDVLRDEALIAVLLLGVVVAVLPGVLDGWQAAANLTMASSELGAAAAIPMWTLALVGSALALGALYSLWSRR